MLLASEDIKQKQNEWTRKLSANEQFLVGAQTVVSLLQTTQIKPRHVIYSRQQSLHQHK